jgi:hypothetical protein
VGAARAAAGGGEAMATHDGSRNLLHLKPHLVTGLQGDVV